MEKSALHGFLGIDGGGTSCRTALLWCGKRYEQRSGSANVTSDLQATVAAITEGLQAVARQAGIDAETLCRLPAHLGLAGATTPMICDQIASALPLRCATVSDDQVTTLVGALGMWDGAVASLGTGSFLARQYQGKRQFLGGHGLHLGDEASGAWLGRAILARVLHSHDGLVAGAALTDEIFAEFGNVAGAVSLFASRATPAAFGQFAPRVAAAAQAGDAAAVALMQAGASYIEAGLTALKWQPGEPVCLMGSLGPQYRGFLPDTVADCLQTPKGTALDGALALAQAFRPASAPVTPIQKGSDR